MSLTEDGAGDLLSRRIEIAFASQHKIRVLWNLIGLAGTCHVGQVAGSRLRIQALGVSLGAYLDRSVHVDLDEVAIIEDVSSSPSIRAIGRYQGNQDNHACVHHELGDLSNASNVLSPVLRGEAKILVQASAHVVAVKHIGMDAECMELADGSVGDRGLS